MSANPYTKFSKEDLILRDLLAIDRTILANERTFLSYLRTALAMVGGGLSFIKFFDSWLVAVVGWLFIPLGLITFAVGFVRYRRMRAIIRLAEDDGLDAEGPAGKAAGGDPGSISAGMNG